MNEIKFLLDTNIVSYYLRRSSEGLEEKLNAAMKQYSCAISVLTRAEIRYGQALMDKKDARIPLIDQFLLYIPCLPWDNNCADQFGQLKAWTKQQGSPRGDFDTQIAAHALAEELILVTHNVKHFAGIENLIIEDWF